MKMKNEINTAALNLFLHSANQEIQLLTYEKCSSQLVNELRKKKAVFYSSFRFCDDLIYSLVDDSSPLLRKYFREIEILVIEDLKDFKNKTASQKFASEVLNSRILAGKKTIIISEKRLGKQRFLSKKLRTTLRFGLVIS